MTEQVPDFVQNLPADRQEEAMTVLRQLAIAAQVPFSEVVVRVERMVGPDLSEKAIRDLQLTLDTAAELRGLQDVTFADKEPDYDPLPEDVTPYEVRHRYMMELRRLYGDKLAEASTVEYKNGWFSIQIAYLGRDGEVYPGPITKHRKAEVVQMCNNLRNMVPEHQSDRSRQVRFVLKIEIQAVTKEAAAKQNLDFWLPVSGVTFPKLIAGDESAGSLPVVLRDINNITSQDFGDKIEDVWRQAVHLEQQAARASGPFTTYRPRPQIRERQTENPNNE